MLTVSVFISGAGWLPLGVSEPLPGYGAGSSRLSAEIRNLKATPGILTDNEPSEGPQFIFSQPGPSLNIMSCLRLPFSLMNECMRGLLEDSEPLRQPTSAIYIISTLTLLSEITLQ